MTGVTPDLLKTGLTAFLAVNDDVHGAAVALSALILQFESLNLYAYKVAA